jgi:hypothetical protein
MTTSPTAVHFDEDTMSVDLADGRTIRVPLAWFPRLLNATPPQRKRVELSRLGLHWEELDEDISVAGLLEGRGDMTRGARGPTDTARHTRAARDRRQTAKSKKARSA